MRVKLDSLMQHRVRLALEVFSEQGAQVPENRDETAAFVSGGTVGSIVLWALSDETDAEGWTTRMQSFMPAWWPLS